ncbi:MAG: hypothetical protein IKQ61_11800 [Spirochaetales bacterium]|nr:hypothetical protein [Spirochaetales bacterium]MBR6060962.1 hypothetical protein [Spirochaetales bacterium]MBR6200930.1 hypothetical protein [Spirochaetales bacterium]
MSDKKALLHYKQHINTLYDSKPLADKYSSLTLYYDDLRSLLSEVCPACGCLLEIAHGYSPVSQHINSGEKFFLSDDDFSAMLAYHCHPDIQSFNYPFNAAGFEAFAQKDKFNLIISDFGLDYSDLFDILKHIVSMLAIGGCFVAVVPAYWFLHDDMNEDETQLLSYSKQTDKKWIFQDNLDFAAEDCGGKVERIVKFGITRPLDRAEAAKLAGLTKLYNAECTGDISILEPLTIPQNLKLTPAAVVIRKEKKTLDKNNLFNI